MPITTSNAVIGSQINTIIQALNRINKLPIGMVAGQAIIQLKRLLITGSVKDFEEMRIDLCQKFGKENKETNNYEFDTPEQEQSFQEAFRDLLKVEVIIPMEKIKLPEMVRIDTKLEPLPVSGEDLEILQDFLA